MPGPRILGCSKNLVASLSQACEPSHFKKQGRDTWIHRCKQFCNLSVGSDVNTKASSPFLTLPNPVSGCVILPIPLRLTQQILSHCVVSLSGTPLPSIPTRAVPAGVVPLELPSPQCWWEVAEAGSPVPRNTTPQLSSLQLPSPADTFKINEEFVLIQLTS